MPVRGVLVACAAAGLLAACGSVRNENIPYSAPLAPPDPLPIRAAQAPYQLAALDRFAVTIYRVPELSREYTVEPSGAVNFPLVGEVQVAGMTTQELMRLLADRYNQTQLRNPSVSVQVLQTTPHNVTVEGSVQTPGNLSVTGPSNLIEVVARAGGPSEFANEKRVIVFRQVNGARQAAAFDLRQVREGLMENPVIYAGDTVIVDGSKLRRDLRDYLLAVPILGVFNPFR